MIKLQAILSLILCINVNLLAQDIQPGTATSAMMDYRGNTSVDFATGKLNYTVPLFDVQSEGFNLPVALNYSPGIKNGEKPRNAGLGWTLGFGSSVIGRTTRGVAIDEDQDIGILNNPVPAGNIGDPVFDQYLAKANAGKIDSESDLFTVNVQGAAINFILIKNGTVIQAKPLQKTDVDIVPIMVGHELRNWIVTDGGGNIYEFTKSQPGYIQTPTNSPLVPSTQSAITSWYISKIRPFNGGDIDFTYMSEEYAEVPEEKIMAAVKYNPVLQVPDLNNPSLSQQLQSLSGLGAETAAAALQLSKKIELIKDAAKRAGEPARPGEITPNGNFINPYDVSEYTGVINLYNQHLNHIISNNGYADYQMYNILNQMYTLTTNKFSDVSVISQKGMFVNKLIQKITFPTGEISFSYQKIVPLVKPPFYTCNKITFRNTLGEHVHSVHLEVSNHGYLKNIWWLNSNGKEKNWLNMDYYFEDHPYQNFSEHATDYWGYYNGKTTNSSLFAADPAYTVLNPGSPSGHAHIFAPGGKVEELNSADRKPDPVYSIARSLKTITSKTGSKVDFTYEGNDIYSADADTNIPIGGLRIKALTVSDATSNRTTTYRYAFPKSGDPTTFRSTGRLNEWHTTVFSWPYMFSTGMDTYTYTHPGYRGGLYNDQSNHNVLYHYVEEVLPDNSVIAYKFPEIDPAYYSSNSPMPDHNSELDRALLAKIYYNADGKIVQIDRTKYAYPTSLIKKRLPEFDKLKTAYPYFIDAGAVQPELWRQIKKEPVHFNQQELLKSYPNAVDPRYSVSVGSYSFSVNPYNSYYYGQWSRRENHQQLALIYNMLLESALQPAEQETLMFTDYDLAAFNSSANTSTLPNEKPYVYDRLMRYAPARRITTATVFTYNGPKSLYPTSIRTVDSGNGYTLTKNKYAWDYTLPSDHVISKMQQMHRFNEVIETQTWKSTDNGVTYKLAEAGTSEYGHQTVEGKTYIYPIKKYNTNLGQLLQLPNTNYTESSSTTFPYTSQFWEGKNIYALEGSYDWNVNDGFLRTGQINDKFSNARSAVVYGGNGLKILEASDVKSEHIFAEDLSPVVTHSYYFERDGVFDNAILYKDTLTFAYLNALTIPQIYTVPRYYTSLNYYKLATDARDVLQNYSNTHYAHYSLMMDKQIFRSFKAIFECIAERKGGEELSPLLGRFYYDYVQSNYLSSEFGQITTELWPKGVNLFAMWWVVDQLMLTSKGGEGIMKMANYEALIKNSSADRDYLFNDDKTYQLSINSEVLSNRFIDFHYLFSNNSVSHATIKAKVLYTNGTSSAVSSIPLSVLNKLNKKAIDLHSFTNHQNIVALQILIPTHDLRHTYAYVAAMPTGTLFKGYSYLPNDKHYLTLDHNCRLEEYFYNELGNYHFTKNEKKEITQMIEEHTAVHDAQMPKFIKVKISNACRNDISMTPRVLSMKLYYPATFSQYNPDFDIPLNIFPGQQDSFGISSGNYRLTLETEPATYELKINNVSIPHNSTGLHMYNIDMTNLNDLDIVLQTIH
ncbi:hypothetical protein FAZ15_14310 [Sphingobacterium olei]|uniref:YD repeat-containing protein n=1 Tax=Sphingobacterium olei TaxID=2571155 RepID=A0A4U0PBN3_9SPHI|nr:hypothetical protein [Sphingobacterium olei]TJZ60054.1 hypothetical protein FAZ15_14310 [Sphingobacterium olei]